MSTPMVDELGHAPVGGGTVERQDAARGGLLRNAWRLPRTRIGLALLVPVVVLVVVGPWLAPHDPFAPVGVPFMTGDGHLLGTDTLGRDVLSRVLAGGRLTLFVAFAATVLGVTLGTVLGVLAALARSWGDAAIMRPLDVLLAFPQYVLVLVVVSMIGASTWLTIVLVALVWTTPVARVMRSAALNVVEQDFVRYSRSLGSGRFRILLDDVLGNVTAPLSVEFGLRLTYSIALVAGLSFIGFGPQPPSPDWGVMVAENQAGLSLQPWATLTPVALIAVLTVGANLVTEGIAVASAHGDGAR
jgi:peptide/nickel transport system permease protein